MHHTNHKSAHAQAEVSRKALDMRQPPGVISTVTTVPVLWTQRETADYLGVSEKSLERWRWAGEGPAYVKAGRRVRYRAADVVAYLDASRTPGGQGAA